MGSEAAEGKLGMLKSLDPGFRVFVLLWLVHNNKVASWARLLLLGMGRVKVATGRDHSEPPLLGRCENTSTSTLPIRSLNTAILSTSCMHLDFDTAGSSVRACR